MKKRLAAVVAALALSVPAGAATPDFVEAQLTYHVMEDGSKAFAIAWDEASRTARIGMHFDWLNHREDWHAGGFDLSNAARRFVDSPDIGGKCELAALGGRLSGQARGGLNFMSVELKGEGCRETAEDFKIEGASFAFYGVPSLDGRPGVPVVRVVVRDAI